jgi:nitroreductase
MMQPITSKKKCAKMQRPMAGSQPKGEEKMDLFEVILKRRSIRTYTAQPVEPEKVQQILDAACRAPSAGNLQAYEIYVVTNAKKRDSLSCAALAQEHVLQAPVDLVFCTNPARSDAYTERGKTLFTIQDATIACTFAMLVATALGLSCAWVGAFDEKAVRQIIGAPENQTPVAILPIGYPAEKPPATPRRPLSEIAHWIS